MNAKSLLVALVAAAGFSSAFAQEATADTWQNVQSTLSRAEVHAQAVAAVRAGEIGYGEATRVVPSHEEVAPYVAKTRSEVSAEARQALRSGQLDHGEVTVF
jgi:hypothetical protein